MTEIKPTLAVWKFASCDGCQLSLLDCEDELLDLARSLEIAYFLEASSKIGSGPFDIALIELWQRGYVEPVQAPPCPYHILAQQLMSTLGEGSAIKMT